jgi:hypothetical protein
MQFKSFTLLAVLLASTASTTDASISPGQTGVCLTTSGYATKDKQQEFTLFALLYNDGEVVCSIDGPMPNGPMPGDNTWWLDCLDGHYGVIEREFSTINYAHNGASYKVKTAAAMVENGQELSWFWLWSIGGPGCK